MWKEISGISSRLCKQGLEEKILLFYGHVFSLSGGHAQHWHQMGNPFVQMWAHHQVQIV